MALTLAPVSANNIGAIIGTTTTAISIKSKKNPKRNITVITTTNWIQNPPGKSCKKSLTNSSPPKALKPDVSIAAPSRIIKTIEVVVQVSITTSFKTLPTLKVLQKLQTMPTKNMIVKKPVTKIAVKSLVSIALIFKLKFFDNIKIGIRAVILKSNG